jgi:2-phosphosulfolactate phosphatase
LKVRNSGYDKLSIMRASSDALFALIADPPSKADVEEIMPENLPKRPLRKPKPPPRQRETPPDGLQNAKGNQNTPQSRPTSPKSSAGGETAKTLRCKVAVREGEEGTDLAAEGRVAVIVDALRASATLCALLEAGAKEVIVAAEVEACQSLAAGLKDAVTVGERGGKQVEGFDLGNSPRAARTAPVAGKTVLMTTTTGALRVVEAQGALEILLGGPRNLSAVVTAAEAAAHKHGADIVVVAAGSSEGAAGMAVEDLASASLIAAKLQARGAKLEPGGFIHIPEQALPELFRNCPNGRRLKELGYGQDVPFCAEIDKTKVVPYVADWIDLPDGDSAAVVQVRSGG